MRTWYNIKGNDFEYMSIKLDSNNNYSINERYEKNRDQCMREHNYEAGSCNDYPDFETDF
ncbi:hypothetical protein IJL65_03100 [bacterium]|nr:hypothetical protein [bacterium]